MHDAMQPVMPRRRRIHGMRSFILFGDISRLVVDRAAVSSGCPTLTDIVDGRRQLVRVAPDDHDGGPGRDEPGGNPLTDSAATAGNRVRPILE